MSEQKTPEDLTAEQFCVLYIDSPSASENTENNTGDTERLKDLNVFAHHI